MYRTFITSAAVAVAALAIVAGASAATSVPTKTAPVACKHAMPTSRAEALACSSRDVNAPLSPATLAGIKRARVAAKGQGLSPDVRQEIYDANQRIAAAVPLAASKSEVLSEKARQAIYDANHRESGSLPQTASDGLDPAIATAIAARERANHAPSLSSGPGFDWGSAAIGAVAGAVLLIAAVGSGALARRRRQPLHA